MSLLLEALEFEKLALCITPYIMLHVYEATSTLMQQEMEQVPQQLISSKIPGTNAVQKYMMGSNKNYMYEQGTKSAFQCSKLVAQGTLLTFVEGGSKIH